MGCTSARFGCNEATIVTQHHSLPRNLRQFLLSSSALGLALLRPDEALAAGPDLAFVLGIAAMFTPLGLIA